jgi:hydroxymethylpyrimidine pyrophosphatase-like HAD family hydrolase
MRYLALASDYDGTLAHDGRVAAATVRALERLRNSNRTIVLVTGRELEELVAVFPDLQLCDWVVAENGGVIYQPKTRQTRALSEPPPASFVQRLRERGVGPISLGRVIVATWHPHESTVLETIRDLGLELQVIFNKGAVMVLPTGVNKATGLAAVLTEIGLEARQVVGIGDAENDHSFLRLCGCSVAVANALPAVKTEATWVTRGDHGTGVCELIDQLIADDLAGITGPKASMRGHGA